MEMVEMERHPCSKFNVKWMKERVEMVGFIASWSNWLVWLVGFRRCGQSYIGPPDGGYHLVIMPCPMTE